MVLGGAWWFLVVGGCLLVVCGWWWLAVVGCRLWVVGCRFSVVGCRWSVAFCLFVGVVFGLMILATYLGGCQHGAKSHGGFSKWQCNPLSGQAQA